MKHLLHFQNLSKMEEEIHENINSRPDKTDVQFRAVEKQFILFDF